MNNPAAYRGDALRSPVTGLSVMVSTGHPLATLAAARVLERGGNAVDAGVAAGFCLGVVHNDMVSVAGVAPILVQRPARRLEATVDGIGWWPARATVDFFESRCGGRIPHGVLRSVVPAAPAAWLTALERWGTCRLEDVISDAAEHAERGFPIDAFMAYNIRQHKTGYARWASSRALYLANGRAPNAGDRFVQPDLARTLRGVARTAAASAGRVNGLAAAREVFYAGEIAEAIVRHHAAEGGLLTLDDLSAYSATVDRPIEVDYRGHRVLCCGPWSQGPVVAQALQILSCFDVAAARVGSAEHLHLIIEALKLAFADREAFYGDPAHVEVPMGDLLSAEHVRARAAMLDPARACRTFRAGGSDRVPTPAWQKRWLERLTTPPGVNSPRDTSAISIIDADGMIFCATPSDTSFDTPVIPGLGFVNSSRGQQAWIDREHPNAVAPRKRPRMTPQAVIVERPGVFRIGLSTPGSDVQPQTLVQVIINIVDFGLDIQRAVEAPRVATYGIPRSADPHAIQPNVVKAESRISTSALERLRTLGHDVSAWPPWAWPAGSVAAVVDDIKRGVRWGVADLRRETFALGW